MEHRIEVQHCRRPFHQGDLAIRFLKACLAKESVSKFADPDRVADRFPKLRSRFALGILALATRKFHKVPVKSHSSQAAPGYG
jgi:hypothetical protein